MVRDQVSDPMEVRPSLASASYDAGDLAMRSMTEMTDDTDQASSTAAPSPWRWVVGALLVLAVAVGLGLRLWYLFHAPTNSDEAIVGLMARGILHGHFVAFYWGQPYGGGEPYVVALLFSVFGQSSYVLALTPVVLAAVASILTWRVARRLVKGPLLALAAGVLVWLGPDAALANSTREYGFRGVTLVCGLACLLFAFRLLDDPRSWVDWGGLGLAAGIGWWSSPEVVYFLVPAALIALVSLRCGELGVPAMAKRLGVGLTLLLVGMLPWLWANVRSSGASLKSSSFPGGAASAVNTGYGGRLSIFFRLWLPIDADLRRLPTGLWLVGGTVGGVLVVAVFIALAVAALLCLLRKDRSAALVVAVLLFPFLFAAQPGTWFWQDGRYIVFLGPLLALVGVAGIEGLGQRARAWGRRPWWRIADPLLVASATLLVFGVLTVAAFTQDNNVAVRSLASGWSDPNASVNRSIAILQAHGVRDGFADYWVAYKVDLLNPKMAITPAPGDVDRSAALDREVDASTQQAWLFVPPQLMQKGDVEFSTTPFIAGPGGVTQSAFVLALAHLGIPYRTINAGLLNAVVPSRPVTIQQVRAAGG
jgi:4-amino-4-deoxy-L-arabinose transferase-like glycosyltransferase